MNYGPYRDEVNIDNNVVGDGWGDPFAMPSFVVPTFETGWGNDPDDTAGGDDSDGIAGTDGNDNLTGGDGADELFGGTGNDNISGGAGGDALEGGTGNDNLIGGGGQDQLFGGADDDRLSGGNGNDTLEGGEGADIFAFERGDDTVLDFAIGQDQVDLSRTTDAASFADVEAGAVQDGADTVLNFEGHLMRLENVALADLSEGDFIF